MAPVGKVHNTGNRITLGVIVVGAETELFFRPMGNDHL